jgi:hypothetical protein
MSVVWHRLEDLSGKGFDEVPSSCGIYLLRWARNSKPVPVSRIGGVDKQGLLYIGKAKRLKRRVRRLWRSIYERDLGSHTVGKTIILCNFPEIVNKAEYEITWESTEDEEGQEWNALVQYARRYKELPPLDLLVGRETYGIWGLGKWGKSKWASEPNDFLKAALGS